MSGVFYEYKIPMGQVQADIAQQTRRIEAGLNKSVDELLNLAADTQILAYSATSNPAPPPASTYTRTFTLQSASETRRTSTKLPKISGVWSANEDIAKAARYVIGKRAQQAKIHRGRWKSIEEVTAIVQKAAPEILERNTR